MTYSYDRRIVASNLKKQDLTKGLKIKQKAHPEYGDWIIRGLAKGTNATWEVDKANGRGSIAVDEAELLKFWVKSAA